MRRRYVQTLLGIVLISTATAAEAQNLPAPVTLSTPVVGGEPPPQPGTSPVYPDNEWIPQILPSGLLYRSYNAGPKEPRFAGSWLYETGRGWIWEISLGGRVGILRHGTCCAAGAEGWQLDIEGAAMPRLDVENQQNLDATDYRFGVPLTWRKGRTAVKCAYYHISSHLGDEYIIDNPGVRRINYVRESLVFGISQDICAATRVYGEVGWAFGRSGGAQPFEFQFGAEYTPIEKPCSRRGLPFAAVNVHLREDVEYGGGVNVLAGWQWKGACSRRAMRVGMQYYNGKSLQYSFFDKHEELIGVGLWFDY